jgi:hypothetical protein
MESVFKKFLFERSDFRDLYLWISGSYILEGDLCNLVS